MTQAEYESKLTEYADSLGLRGVISDSVIKLLAYSINLKNSEVNEKILNSSFASSTNLNTRIAHAASLLYSVYRGQNPTITMSNVVANMDKVYRYLDDAFQYNGMYYFYNQDISTQQSQVYTVNYVVSDKPRQSTSQLINDMNYHYIDFNNANISESLRILKDGTKLATWTDNAYEFMSHTTEELEYLVVTIPNYGIRILKRYNQDWDCTRLTVEYLVYYENLVDITNLRSIGDFVYDLDTSTSVSISYIPRMESGEAIYMDATKTFMSRNQIGSLTDVEAIIEGTYDPNTGEYVSTYNIVYDNNRNTYYVYVKCGQLVCDSIAAEIRRRNAPYSFVVTTMSSNDVTVKCTLVNSSYTMEELNAYFNPIWQSARELDTAQMTAQILRHDTKLISCSLEVTSGSLDGLKPNEYFNITLTV